MRTRHNGPDLHAIAEGNVRGWHIVVLFGLVFLLTFLTSYLLSKQTDPLFRSAWQPLLSGCLMLLCFTVVTICVPELRRLFVECFRGGGAPPNKDILIVIALTVTWALGAARILFGYSIVLFDPIAGLRWLGLGPKSDPGPTLWLLATIHHTVIAPIVEEIIFRGYLLNLWLAKHRLWIAIWGSSIVFGLWHFKTAPFATILGLVFAIVYVKYRSLILCMLLHAFHNLLMNRVLLGRFFMDKDANSIASASSWAVEFFLTALFIPLAWLFWKRFRPQQSQIS